MGLFSFIKNAAVGFLSAGPTGAVIGAARDIAGGRRAQKAEKARSLVTPRTFHGSGLTATGSQLAAWRAQGLGACGPGMARDSRGTCVSSSTLVAVQPILNRQFSAGGDCIFPWRRDPVTGDCKLFAGTGTGPEGGTGTDLVLFEDAVVGAFGMPAIRPLASQRVQLSCPTGMALGRDDLCYPRKVLPRNSKFRKWRPGRRPLFTGGDLNTISRARSLIMEGKNTMAALGVTAKKRLR